MPSILLLSIDAASRYQSTLLLLPVYEMLRTVIDAKIRRAKIVVDSLVYDVALDAVSVITSAGLSYSDMRPNAEGAMMGVAGISLPL
jgi:metal-sulfur cluster biosynthetic enzyme